MIEVIPAILDKSFNEMSEHIRSVLGLVKMVQVDLCDGIFVSSKTWPYTEGVESDGSIIDSHFLRIINEEEGMPYWEDVDFELHLMVEKAHEQFGTFLKLGAKSIVFQIEAEGDLNEFKEFLESIDPYTRDNIQIGVSIKTTTPVENIFPIIPIIDFVQCMGIDEIGVQGQPFDERVFDHIKILQNRYPELIISVDGSINENNADKLATAGVKKFVIGSALLKSPNIKEAINYFQNI